MNEYLYLAHGGPGSGRYPLGSGDRPYQKYEDSRKRSSGGIGGYIKSRKAKKAEAQKLKAAEEDRERKLEEARKRKEEEDKQRAFELEKRKVAMSGTPAEILKYQGMWTKSELEDISKRLKVEKELKDYTQAELKSSMDKIDKIMQNVQTGTKWLTIGSDTYNAIAAIYNATPDGRKKPLTFVQKPNAGGGQGQQQGGGGKKKK